MYRQIIVLILYRYPYISVDKNKKIMIAQYSLKNKDVYKIIIDNRRNVKS